nr:isoprenylcysteine carboxylmethyltransferase family protein [Microvirga antarctica]
MALAVLTFVTLQRAAELVIARRNTHALLANGAREVSPGHYPLIILVHTAWLAGLWVLAWDRPVAGGWLALFILLQAGRLWVLATLGRRWTTRIIVQPGETLVRSGPYRFVSHPNYVVVAGEIAVLPLAFGLPWFALVFSLLNAAVLLVRIRAEQAGLSADRAF